MAKLRDAIEAIEAHLSGLDDFNLKAIEARLPKDASPGSAEMMMLKLVYREMENRKE